MSNIDFIKEKMQDYHLGWKWKYGTDQQDM